MNQGTIGGYWPLYEDGTPVRIGDTVEANAKTMKVRSVDVCAPDTVLFGDIDHLRLEPGKRVKRVGDAPEGAPCLCKCTDGGLVAGSIAGDRQNWHIAIDGVRYGVSNHARRVIAEALDLTTSQQTLPPGIEWPEVDGKPVVPGDVLWDDMGLRNEVSEVKFSTGFMSGAVEMDKTGNVWWLMDDLARTKPESRPKPEPKSEPDSWERIAEDALKGSFYYWSCLGIDCCDCPAVVGGQTPRQRYGTRCCFDAMDADIVARVKALAWGARVVSGHE